MPSRKAAASITLERTLHDVASAKLLASIEVASLAGALAAAGDRLIVAHADADPEGTPVDLSILRVSYLQP